MTEDLIDQLIARMGGIHSFQLFIGIKNIRLPLQTHNDAISLVSLFFAIWLLNCSCHLITQCPHCIPRIRI